jgi:hypothetical protein
MTSIPEFINTRYEMKRDIGDSLHKKIRETCQWRSFSEGKMPWGHNKAVLIKREGVGQLTAMEYWKTVLGYVRWYSLVRCALSSWARILECKAMRMSNVQRNINVFGK